MSSIIDFGKTLSFIFRRNMKAVFFKVKVTIMIQEQPKKLQSYCYFMTKIKKNSDKIL